MVEIGTKALALSKIEEFDIIFAEYAEEDEVENQLVISGENVAIEFQKSGLFDSDLSDVSSVISLVRLLKN